VAQKGDFLIDLGHQPVDNLHADCQLDHVQEDKSQFDVLLSVDIRECEVLRQVYEQDHGH